MTINPVARIMAWACFITLSLAILFTTQKAYAQVPEDFKQGFVALGKQYGPILLSVCATDDLAKKVVESGDKEAQQKTFDDEEFCGNSAFTFIAIKVVKEYPDGTKIIEIRPPKGKERRFWFTTLKVHKGETI